MTPLLEEKWELVHADLQNKECALTCYGEETWYVRRHIDGEPIVFREKADLVWLLQETAVEIIPAIHEKDSLAPVEAVIDIDPAPQCAIEETIRLTDDFTEFLMGLGLQFYRRLSGGSHSGEHIIIPVELSRPLPLVSSPLKPQTFLARHGRELLINSLRHTITSLILHYMVTRASQFPLARWVTPTTKMAGYWKFDVSRNAPNSGRRCVLSSHAATERLVIPVPTETLGSSYYHYQTLTEPNEALFASEELVEPDLRRSSIRRKNATILEQLGEETGELWVAYKSTYPSRFRALYLGGSPPD